MAALPAPPERRSAAPEQPCMEQEGASGTVRRHQVQLQRHQSCASKHGWLPAGRRDCHSALSSWQPIQPGSSTHLKIGRSVVMGKSVSSSEASWCSPSSEPRTDSLASPALSTN